MNRLYGLLFMLGLPHFPQLLLMLSDTLLELILLLDQVDDLLWLPVSRRHIIHE